MKNDIKKMLKAAADKQEINDLQSYILKSVDTSKVLHKEIVAPKRRIPVLPFLFGGVAAAALCIGIGLSIGFSNSRPANNPVGDDPINNHVEPTNDPVTPTVKPTEPVIPTEQPINTDNESPIYYHIDVKDILDSDLKVMYDNIIKQNLYDMVNAANTFNDVKFSPLDAEHSSTIDADFEKIIADDVNLYLYNIENMLGLEQSLTTADVDNTNPDFNYETVLTVSSSHYSYKMYFNEIMLKEKTNTSYKYKGKIDGVILIGEEKYTINGIKHIKNDCIEFDVNVNISDTKFVRVEEKFTASTNNYKFTYHYDDKYKQVTIDQKLDENANTKELAFNVREQSSVDATKDISSFKLTAYTNETNYIECKLKNLNGEYLTINKNNDFYIYKFKNSGNAYSY